MDSLNLQSKSGPSDRACKALDIATLIEKSPLTRLNGDYQSKLVNKIKESFTDTQQQLFVSSFYCYLNYDQASDFVVKLNDVWKWIGFSRINDALRVLKKNFVKDVDYIVENLSLQVGKAVLGAKQNGGQNKETITMTIKTFNKFCMKARTSKADEIHDYYVKLESLVRDIVNEESNELRNRLLVNKQENEELRDQLVFESENKELFIQMVEHQSELDKQQLLEKTY